MRHPQDTLTDAKRERIARVLYGYYIGIYDWRAIVDLLLENYLLLNEWQRKFAADLKRRPPKQLSEKQQQSIGWSIEQLERWADVTPAHKWPRGGQP